MLTAVEEKLIDLVKKALGRTVKNVQAHPGRWGDAFIKQLVTAAPTVYIGFSAGNYQAFGSDQLKGNWHIYLVGTSLNGKSKQIGIYQMIQTLLPALHGQDLDQADALKFKSVKNLFSFADGAKGIACYEMIFELPMSWLSEEQAQGTLDEWLSYHADHYDENDPEHLMAAATVELNPGE